MCDYKDFEGCEDALQGMFDKVNQKLANGEVSVITPEEIDELLARAVASGDFDDLFDEAIPTISGDQALNRIARARVNQKLANKESE